LGQATKIIIDKEKLQERLAKLSDGIAVIKVGAPPLLTIPENMLKHPRKH